MINTGMYDCFDSESTYELKEEMAKSSNDGSQDYKRPSRLVSIQSGREWKMPENETVYTL